ncbi:MAG TPA: DUF72 domain-containing protein [Puia sp.]|nr:DUF72 domain-containing protein [Puia sp.]
MEFGKVTRVDDVDFSLPTDDPMTDQLFEHMAANKKAGKEQPVNLYVGCTQWGNKNWLGRLYPKGTKDKDFLAHYVKQFNCIELNALFYNLQPRSVIERWASLADKSFRFCPKFSNTISHTLQLKNTQRDTDLFIEHMQHFGPTLGYSFLQLSDKFGPDRADTLQDYLRQLPRDFRTCVELRQENWFPDVNRASGSGSPAANYNKAVPAAAPKSIPGAANDTWQLFRDLGIGAVITDSAGRRDCVHMKLTAPVAFIRFVGNNLHPTDYTRIDAWAGRLKTWIAKGLREIYFIIHSPDELYAPELALYTVEQFNRQCGTNLQPPKLLKEDQSKNLTLF